MATTVVNLRRERYDRYIGRPDPLGNPFVIGVDGDRPEVVRKHREWFLRQPELVEQVKRELTGKVLGCYCKPAACHGDVYAEVCNNG